MNNQKGFTIVEVAVVVLVVGLLAFIGLRTWGSYNSQELANVSDPNSVVTVTDSKSLETIEKQLDNIDVVGSFESELDAESTF